MIITALKLGNKVRVYNEKRKYQLDKLTSTAYDYFGGIREIKSFNIFDKIFPIIRERRTEYLDANAKYNVRFNCNNSAILFVFELFFLLLLDFL